jgi:hypothetical protein
VSETGNLAALAQHFASRRVELETAVVRFLAA